MVAIFARLDVLGFQRLEYELTRDAIDLGLDAALPPILELESQIGEFGRGERASRLLNSAIPAFRDDQPHAEGVPPGDGAKRMRDGYLRGALSRPATQRQMDVLAAFVAAGGSVPNAAELVGIRPSTVKRHLADMRARSGLTTEQLIYAGRAGGWLVVPSLEPS